MTHLAVLEITLIDPKMEFAQNTNMTEYIIKLIKTNQQLYRLIYSLKQTKLETLKTYIQTHLKTEFI